MGIIMKNRENRIVAGLGVIVFIVLVAFIFVISKTGKETGKNLALMRGVKATCDSEENDNLNAGKAIDGDDENLESRWSSKNNWEDSSHYIELEFPEEISVSFVVLKWERRNAIRYALTGSPDGITYRELASFDSAPSYKNQEIPLQEEVKLKKLRLEIYDVSKNEEDYSNLYQNVSLYEFEVYADKPVAYQIQEPEIVTAEDGSRKLLTPGAPEGYEISFIGADLEQVIGQDGTIYDTIADKKVQVGYLVQDLTQAAPDKEVSFEILVPAMTLNGTETHANGTENPCPEVIPQIAEWKGETGYFRISPESRLIIQEGIMKDAGNLSLLPSLSCVVGTVEDLKPGDIYLGFTEEENGLGEEGYTMQIGQTCKIEATTNVGIQWGVATLLQLLEQHQQQQIPCGVIRDYPCYEVRGFGIDVARKAVSLDTLYEIIQTMSYYKMNDLMLHLNDNTILSTSGLTDTTELAMTADSAFRLESEIANKKGDRLTSTEYAYSKEEMNALIEMAEAYGVQVVPEIDTPAHALSITKIFPEYALMQSSQSVDQIDLNNENARKLVKDIWHEALDKDTGAFRNAKTVNIGMDEYYGDGRQYRSFLGEIQKLVQDENKNVRLWGSLSNMSGEEMPDKEGLQMNVWSTIWADPVEMYKQGYSIINMQNNHLYCIAGGGYDYLDCEELYENWEPNRFYDHAMLETVPEYSPQMLGASYMIWNDMSGNLDINLSEIDLYERFLLPIGVLAEKLWATGSVEETDTEDPYGHFNNLYEKTETGRRNYKHTFQMLYPENIGIEPPYEISMEVVRNTDAEQILTRSDAPYGEWVFYASEKESGKVGFAREGKTFVYPYTLPEGETVTLRIVGEMGKTSLYANGKYVGEIGSAQAFENHASFVFPVQYLEDGVLSLQTKK